MRRKISQAEALGYKIRAEKAEATIRDQKNRWRTDWAPGWVNIETLNLKPESFAKVATARLLNHAVVVVPDSNGTTVRLYADRFERMQQ